MFKRVLILSLVFSLFIAGCGNTNKIIDQTKINSPINIAFDTWIGYSSFYVAEYEGIFEKYGLKVQTSVIDSLSEKNAAVIRRDLDGMGGTLDSSIISKTSGVDGQIVMLFDRSDGTNGILVSEGISSVSDLKGKRIALEEGFVGHFFLLYMLEKAGLSRDDITIVPMSTEQAGTAFLAGKVDAAVTWEPLLSQALERDGSTILVSSADVDPILVDVLYLGNAFLKERKDDAEKLVAALLEANELWKNNQEKYLPLLDEKRGWGQDELAATMETVELYDSRQQVNLLKDSNGDFYKMLDIASQLWYDAGIVDQIVEGRSLVNPSFILSNNYEQD